MALEAARNIGPATATWLRAVGVHDLAEVARRGVIPTALAVRAAGHPLTFTGVLALQGALMELDWRAVPAGVRDDLAHDWRAAQRAGRR